ADTQHRKSVRTSIRAGHALNAAQGSGHRRQVAAEIGGNAGIVNALFGSADLRSWIVTPDFVACAADLYRVEQRSGRSHSRVGDEDVFVSGALDLESLGGIADGGKSHHIVAVAAGEGDG